MPRCCVRMSKEQANFALGQRVIMGEVSVTSDSDPMEHGAELRLSLSSRLTLMNLAAITVFNVTSALK